MKEFKDYLHRQLLLHPSMQPRDVVKLCYQAAFGAEHLLTDNEGARRYFDREFAAVPCDSRQPLYEQISHEICRVNLGAWKAAGFNGGWLFRMFADHTAVSDSSDRMVRYLYAAEEVLRCTDHGFGEDAWSEYLASYQAAGMPAVRHTEQYRAAEQPAYRIVNTKYLRILPVLLALKERQGGIIAIDGRAGAGKSTVAELLSKVLHAGIVYMDDFFLPSELRSPDRLSQPGGNIHYERFFTQVVSRLGENETLVYDVFDCSCMRVHGQRSVGFGDWRIVEGSYSHHPYFGKYADLRVFADVDAAEQLRRIERRNGAEMLELFHTRWIPMEEAYFEAYGIEELADIII